MAGRWSIRKTLKRSKREGHNDKWLRAIGRKLKRVAQPHGTRRRVTRYEM